MLYHILRWLFTLTVKGYFRSISIRGLERIPRKGPILLAANHTSAFMDPIVLGVYIRRSLYFLSRGSAFQKPFIARILGILHMIPIYRPEFEPDDLDKNQATFERCYAHLGRGGAMLIFPEGVSQTVRKLRPLKSGIARIGLGAEAQHDFRLGVSIIPIGINYSNPHHFQGDVFVNIGKPIVLQQFQQQYQADPKETTHAVMNLLQHELEKRTIHIEDERLNTLVNHIEQLYRSTLRDDGLDADKIKQDFYLSKDIADAVAWHDTHYPDQVITFDRRIRAYLHHAESLRLRDTQLRKSHPLRIQINTILELIAGFPLFLFGWIVNVLPFKLAEWTASRIRVREDFVGSIRMASGMFVFLFVYLLQAILIMQWTNWYIGLALLISFYPAGVFALFYLKTAYQFRYTLDFWSVWSRKRSLIDRLRETRQTLIDELEEGRKRYMHAVLQFSDSR